MAGWLAGVSATAGGVLELQGGGGRCGACCSWMRRRARCLARTSCRLLTLPTATTAGVQVFEGRDGAKSPGFEAFHASTAHTSPLLYDIDLDGVPDIVLATYDGDILFFKDTVRGVWWCVLVCARLCLLVCVCASACLCWLLLGARAGASNPR